MCLAQSALNNIIVLSSYPDILEHTLIEKFIKGVFNIKPPAPLYPFPCGTKKVFILYGSVTPMNEKLPMKLLSEKTVMLLLLIRSKKISLTAFSVESMQLTQTECIFITCKPSKHSR